MTATIANSTLVQHFPFPFVDDKYRYSTNVEPAAHANSTAAGDWGAHIVDVDGDYLDELAERDRILAADPGRYAVLAHMQPAAWDAMLTLLRELARTDPEHMRLTPLDDDRWRWENELLGIDDTFAYGDAASLAVEPLRYIGTQVQEDIVLLDQRNEQLFADGGLVTFAADWSFGFDVGMSFLEIHGPVPRVRNAGVITRAHEFIKRLQPHQPYRRTNWTMTIGHRLDVSTELYPEWGPDREMIGRADDETFGRLVHLRVEVQHLIRLPDSGAIMFLIRTYMLPLEQLATVEPWRARAAEVLAELPDDMADYKGIIKYCRRAADWLRDHAPVAEADEAVAVTGHSAPDHGLPHWPGTPPDVDTDGSSFLIIAAGDDAQVGHVARNWVVAAEAAGPTRMLVVDDVDKPDDRVAIDRHLNETATGARILVVGGQYEVMVLLARARAAGAIAPELSCFVTDTRELPVYCAHCRDTHRVVGEPDGIVVCPGCAARLAIHPHHSATRGSFLASAADAREL